MDDAIAIELLADAEDDSGGAGTGDTDERAADTDTGEMDVRASGCGLNSS